MGVYIPNMEKPKRCIEELGFGLLNNPCLFVDEREACLLQEDSKIGEYEENYKTCPLIEIVECKDCKYWTDDMSGNMWCEHAIGGLTEPTDFCSYGERRADDTDNK